MAWRLVHCYKAYSRSVRNVICYCNASVNMEGSDRYEIITSKSTFISLAQLNDNEICPKCLIELKHIYPEYENMKIADVCQTPDFKMPTERPTTGWVNIPVYKKAIKVDPQLELF